MGISSYSTTPSSNTSISGINIAEGCAPSGINDAIRQLMADVATDAVTKTGTQTLTNKTLTSPTVTGMSTDTLTTTGNVGVGGTLSVTGHTTLEGVTSTGATGTGKLVYDTSPTVALASASTAVTQSAADSSTKIATTAFVNNTALTLKNGTTATTQSAADNSTKVATTAYVDNAVSSTSSSGIAKAWVSFDGTSAGPTITPKSSFNISSITKNGTGDYTIAFTSSMADANYCAVGIGSSNSGVSYTGIQVVSQAAGNIRIQTWYASVGVYDAKFCSIAIFA